MIKNYFNEFLNFIFSAECLHCRRSLPANGNLFICNECLASVRIATNKILSKEKERKFKDEESIKDFYSPFIFEKDGALQSLLHQLKYNNKFGLGIFLGKLIGENSKTIIDSWNCDLLVPIPLHPIKKAERGYNQSKLLAKGISEIVKIKVKSGAIKRVKFTESQTKMNLAERQKNVENIFKARSDIVENKNLILVDDVITTGSTITSAARELKNKGANNIYALSVAIAKPNDFSSI